MDQVNLEKAKQVVDELIRVYGTGVYPLLVVKRPWSTYNPIIQGEIAKPSAYRLYLEREIAKLFDKGAEVEVQSSRETTKITDLNILNSLDETQLDLRNKKLFLFTPERVEMSINRLEHYTGTRAEDFQKYIIFTNYNMHMQVFLETFPDSIRPDHEVQMPAYHARVSDEFGVSIINIGVGPSNAKTISDHVAVTRPDAMIMIGHCGGLRNHQNVGDFVLASHYLRDDGVFDKILPQKIPVIPYPLFNQLIIEHMEDKDIDYRIGCVYTTANRNWEFTLENYKADFADSRAIAIDMESATIAVNGYRYRVPHSTLLMVSDRPLHGKPKLSDQAQKFYQDSKEKHVGLVLDIFRKIEERYPEGFPSATIRGPYEPLLGSLG